MLTSLKDLCILDNCAIGQGALSRVVRCTMRGSSKVFALKMVGSTGEHGRFV